MNPIEIPLSKFSFSSLENIDQENIQKMKLKQVARSLEGVFAGYLLSELGKSLPGTQGMAGQSVYADFFKQAITHQLSEGKGLGLASMIEMSIQQEQDREEINEIKEKPQLEKDEVNSENRKGPIHNEE